MSGQGTAGREEGGNYGHGAGYEDLEAAWPTQGAPREPEAEAVSDDLLRRRRAARAAMSPKRRRRVRRSRAIAAGLALAAGSTGLAMAISPGVSGASTTLAGNPTKLLSSAVAATTTEVAADVDPAIVDVNTVLADGAGTAAGTGMVLTSDGYILTNNHVVEDAVQVKVTIPSHGTYAATVVGTDATKDIAVIKVSGLKDLTTVRFASTNASVGTAVVAIGNALGKGGAPSVTAGTIIALSQDITAATDFGPAESLTGLVETSASLEPGDSGGPLLDQEGAVVGMDTAAEATMSDSSSTVAYSIPTNTLVEVAGQIVAGKAGNGIEIGPTSYLGVVVSDLSGYGFGPGGYGQTSAGVRIQQVVSGSPAAKAGFQAGDVVLAVDGQSVSSATSLKQLLTAHKPGSKVTIEIETFSGTETVGVTLVAGPVA